MQFVALEHMPAQGIDQRPQQGARLSDPVGERRAVEIDPVACVDLALAVQRQVIDVFRDQHMRQEAGTRQSSGDRSARRRRLHDLLAGGATELRPDVADYLEPRRHVFQDLGDILAKGPQSPATGRAVAGGLMHDDLAWQALRQRTARRLGPLGGGLGLEDRCGFGRARLQLLETQLQLGDRLIELFGGTAELDALQACQFDFELFDFDIT